MNEKWTTANIPDQHGRVAVVTGANTGLGYETAKALAERGASVVLAVRNVEKGEQAAARMTGDVTVQALDLTSLDSVRTAAAALRSRLDRIDLLINNAGVMYTPKQTTRDGFEMQFGTNHLGHFALTGLLLDLMLPVPGSRVVTVSSTGHRIRAAIHFDDLQWERSYSRVAAYGQSKLANLMFTYELQQPARHARHHRRVGRAPRHLQHRARPQHPRGPPASAHLARAADHPDMRPWARCRPCAPPPTPPRSAASTTVPADATRSRATPGWSPPARSRTRQPSSSGCGPSPKTSPG